MKLLNLRSFELKSNVHDVLDHVWKTLVQVSIDAGRIAIYDALPGEPIRTNANALLTVSR